MRVTMLLDNLAAEPSLAAEHGLSLYIETEKHRILFDAGQSDAFARNAEALGIDLAAVDIAILSHGHYDHSGGLARFLELNDHAPLYLHRSAFERREAERGRDIGLAPSLADSPRLVFTDDILHLDVGLALITCNQRERRFPSHSGGLYQYKDGVLEQDAFLHEQYLCIHENGRNVLISGCSHKGILNIVDAFRPDILIGGFHFMKIESEATLEAAAKKLLEYDTVYYTGHCTGQKQYDYLKTIMGEKLHYISAGTILEL